jgi:hypothetical protein
MATQGLMWTPDQQRTAGTLRSIRGTSRCHQGDPAPKVLQACTVPC